MSSDGTRTFMMPVSRNRYYCPLSVCGWTCDEPDAVGAEKQPARGFTSASEMLQFQLGAVEKAVRKHLETHTLLEWVTEISRLREVVDLTAISLSDSGQIGTFVRAATVPGSPVADSLEMLRERIASAAPVTEAGRG